MLEREYYIDGQHNGGVYNSFNHNTYIYCYQSPVKLVDPNGKQVSAVYGLDSAELLSPSNFNTSTSRMTGAIYGTGRTLNYLGNNNVSTRGKLANTTKGTSIASQYFREKFGNKLLPKSIRFSGKTMSTVNKALRDPLLTNNIGGLIGRSVPYLGKSAIVVGIGGSIYNISTSDNKPMATIRESGIWGGAIAGAETGATLGGAIGGPLGAAAGGIGGGILGGVAGESAVKSLLEPITPCGSCNRPSDNYLESGMRIDGGLRAIQDRINQNQQNLNN